MPGSTRSRLVVAAAALAALALVLAGCGGGGSNKSSSGTTQQTRTDRTRQPGGQNYDPAHTIATALGLQICSSTNVPGSLFVDPHLGFAGARKFETAKDCSKKGPRTLIEAMTFSSHAGIAAGKADIKKHYPKAGISSFRTVVIGVVGPANAQQLADKIIKQLSAGTTNG